MRNTTLRKIIDSVTKQVNEGIQNGIEPLALAMCFRQIADQCDRLAEQFEKQEAAEAEKEKEEGDKDD